MPYLASIILMHPPRRILLIGLTLAPTLCVSALCISALCISALCISALSWRLVERPALKLKRLVARLRGRDDRLPEQVPTAA